MRPAEFAPKVIIEAGQELRAAGRNITGFALRQKIGGGNPSRLKQVWDEHLASQSVTKAEPVAELPIEVAEEMAAITKALTERLATLAVELNDKAVKAAERRVHEVVRSAGEHREQAERELADASQTVGDLENWLDAAVANVEAMETKLADVQMVNQTQAVELAQLRERLTVIEQTAKTASEQHIAELTRMNITIEAERTSHQQVVKQLRAELTEQRQLNLGATSDRDQVRTELVIVKAKAEAADQEAARQAERYTKAQGERDEAQKTAATAKEKVAELTGKLEAVEGQNAVLLTRLGLEGQASTKESKKK